MRFMITSSESLGERLDAEDSIRRIEGFHFSLK